MTDRILFALQTSTFRFSHLLDNVKDQDRDLDRDLDLDLDLAQN
jgi:hypothetical protein